MNATAMKAFVALLLLAGLATGITIAFSPMKAAWSAVTVAAFLVALRQPRPWVTIVLAFLVLQDPLQVIAGGDTPLAQVVKWTDELLVFGTGVFCLLAYPTVREFFRTPAIALSLTLAYGGMAVSSLLVQSEPVPALFDLAMFSKPFLIFCIGLSIQPNEGDIELRLPGVLIAICAVVGFAVVFLVSPELQEAYMAGVREVDERLGFVSAQGFFIGPNAYSWFSAAGFCLAYAGYLCFRRYFYLIASMTCALFVLLSWRRKSMLAVALVVGMSLVLRGRSETRLRAFAVTAMVAVICATVLAPYLGGLWIRTVEEYGSADPLSSARHALYYGSALIARDHFPFGAGFGSFGSFASKMFYSDLYEQYGLSRVWGLSPQDPHFITDTFWPMVLGQGGVVSLFGYLLFFGVLARRTWRTIRAVDFMGPSTYLPLAAIFLLAGSLIESTASHVYNSSLHAALVLVPMAMAWRFTDVSYRTGVSGASGTLRRASDTDSMASTPAA